MSVRHQVHYTDGTSTAVTNSGAPPTLSINLIVDPTGGMIGVHDSKNIEWIDVFYAQADFPSFLLKCTPPSGQTPTINKITVATKAQAAGAGTVGQGNTTSWATSGAGTFDITFTQPGSTEGSITWEFNPGTSTPPLKLKVIVRRDP